MIRFILVIMSFGSRGLSAWFAGQTEKVEQIEERLRVLESTRRREKVAEPRVVAELNRIAGGQRVTPGRDIRPYYHTPTFQGDIQSRL